jgi:NodT family efflux transporter outer membrane factor (OMF) lipoprotein
MWLLAVLACAGCASTTQSEVGILAADIPTGWHEDTASVAEGPLSDLGAWWLRFTDPTLASLVESALDENFDAQKAAATLEQAVALRDEAAAGLSATIGYSASAQRNFNGDTAAANNLQAGINAGWTPDVFGAQRRALDASNANVQAVLAQWGGVQSNVASGVALNYIVLRSSQARLAIAQQNLVSQRDTLQIAQWRNQAGLIGAVEVEQAQAAAQQTSAQLPLLEQSIARTLHALSVQAGQPPAALYAWLSTPAPLPVASANLQLLTPAATLLARPDVIAAQYQVAGAIAGVDQARARRYPALNVSANLGAGAASIAALSSSSALLAGVAVSLVGPLFDGGALRAQVRAAQAALKLSRANYRGTQLTALQEVEDALVSLRTDRARVEQLEGVVAAAERAALMARQRFASGLVDFQIVLETQRSQLAAQDAKAQADATVGSDQVRLYSALGGGWKQGACPGERATDRPTDCGPAARTMTSAP